MDLDQYYAEQEKTMNLPHETLEEYRKRLAVLKRQHVEQHVDSFFAVNAAPQVPSRGMSDTSVPLGVSDDSHCKVSHKMSENEPESASKRRKLENSGEYPPEMQGIDIAAAQSLHSPSSVSMPVLNMNGDDDMGSNLVGSQLPVISGSQRGPKRSSANFSLAKTSDDPKDSTKPRASPGLRSCVKQSSISGVDLARHIPLSHSTDGLQDDIDSFTEDNIRPLESKVNYVAKDIPGAGQGVSGNSPIGSFSMKSGKQSIQEVMPSRRQQRLELRPVSDVAQLLGKKPEHAVGPATSPIEDVSSAYTKPNASRNVVPENSINTGSTTRIAKHAVDQRAGEVAPAAEGSMTCTTSSPPQLQGRSLVASCSKVSKKEDKVIKKTATEKKPKGKKDRPQLMTPVKYAQMLQEKAAAARVSNNDEARSSKTQKQRKKPAVKFLEGKNIFYTGGDMNYASETTRGRMDIIVRFGGNLMPQFDPRVTTHVLTDANVLSTLRAVGVKTLGDIPDHIPTVRWSWVLSVLGKESVLSREEIEKKLGDTWLYAAFSQRMDAGYQEQKTVSLASLRDRRVSDKTQGPAAPGGSSGLSSSNVPTAKGDDPLRTFYLQAKEERLKDDGWSSFDELGDSDDAEEIHVEPVKPVKRGWTCDTKGPPMPGNCPNQDIIDKLAELMQLHQAKVGDEDHWRAFTYNKCIRALRSYPKRIETFEEAKKIRGIGEKTARKIEEILQTGDLRRIKYERTEDVIVTRLFQGIYGVGQSTAMQWWAAGCRTLDDLRESKGGVKLNAAQEIGLLYYDDINNRMPRAEAKAIFDVIKKIALEIDPNLFVELMGSYRRGKSTCGDIDILITRPTDDGKTHSGVLSRLLNTLHVAKILTEDLALPDNPEDLEAIYRGLCMQPDLANARRRRIDFLCVPWKSRGAALIYYTGDDIFNRAMRLKANVMGYSLNQKGLFGNVIRDPRDKRVKLDDGVLVASETEEEIFNILGVPWQEPQERVRG